jgi:hypothetical protein
MDRRADFYRWTLGKINQESEDDIQIMALLPEQFLKLLRVFIKASKIFSHLPGILKIKNQQRL